MNCSVSDASLRASLLLLLLLLLLRDMLVGSDVLRSSSEAGGALPNVEDFGVGRWTASELSDES